MGIIERVYIYPGKEYRDFPNSEDLMELFVAVAYESKDSHKQPLYSIIKKKDSDVEEKILCERNTKRHIDSIVERTCAKISKFSLRLLAN